MRGSSFSEERGPDWGEAGADEPEHLLLVGVDDLRLISEAAAKAWPEECCGLLVGDDHGGVRRARQVVPSPNRGDDPRHSFEIDAGLLLRTQRHAREAGLTILGTYHSHPNGTALPSEADRAGALVPGQVWLILPVIAGVAGAPSAFLAQGDASTTALRPIPVLPVKSE